MGATCHDNVFVATCRRHVVLLTLSLTLNDSYSLTNRSTQLCTLCYYDTQHGDHGRQRPKCLEYPPNRGDQWLKYESH